jgi:hypothetical protein
MLPLLVAMSCAQPVACETVPPSWEIAPIPRCVRYGSPHDFIALGRVAIVRPPGGLYETVRDAAGELVPGSSIIEEELTRILREAGVTDVVSVGDDPGAWEAYDTVIVLGAPRANRVAAQVVDRLGLSFGSFDDPNTEGDDFARWSDLGAEGYVLRVGRLGGQGVVLLAGYDRPDALRPSPGAGTFYAVQSFRQLLVPGEAGPLAKTVEVADAPLVAVRGCFSGFDGSADQQWRDIEILPRIKANQNIYWYGNSLAAYNSEAASRFRYPWKPEQLEAMGEFGRYCGERFVTTVFCMNPDHYNVDWAAAKTFDGSAKDPVHYDPDYPVEPEFAKLWAEAGYEVHTDVDILAAKFAQLQTVVPGAVLQVMNEDDLFGLVHESDKALYGATTGDAAQDGRNYGRARGLFLARLYRRIREVCEDSVPLMPVCPPGQLCYQHVLDRGDPGTREFMESLSATLREEGLLEHTPLLTTGGGTAAEVLTCEAIERFRGFGHGAPAYICDNNFPAGFHIGAYETDPKGPRSPYQINETLPAGFRDRGLYRDLWGIAWNGLNDQHVMAWNQAQYMWNMGALDRERANALAARRETDAAAYPLVKSLLEEFDNPACYTPDCQPPYRVKQVTDTIAFPSDEWVYRIDYPDARRRECERVRAKLSALLPELVVQWSNEREREAFLKYLGYPALTFVDVYLAYGYIRGWEGGCGGGRLSGAALRDLYLQADDIQQRYFAGPKVAPGRLPVDHHYYSGHLHYLYWDGAFKMPPQSVEEADGYVDVWREGLLGRFYEPCFTVEPGALADGDARLVSGWGVAGEADGAGFRTVAGEAELALPGAPDGEGLLRLRIGAEDGGAPEAAGITLQVGDATLQDAVAKPRWIDWPLAGGAAAGRLTLRAERPVRVYAVEACRAAEG